jgi:hypothetical protein
MFITGLGWRSLTGAEQASDALPPPNPAAEKEERDKATDKEHLLTIWKALMEYKKAKGDLPNYLSDLVPRFLPDKSVLLSPAKQAGLRGRTDPKLPTSYVYEFRGDLFGSGPKTFHELKPYQVQEYGPIVPIVRCFAHGDTMNVTYGGDYFESPLFWETSPAIAEMIQKKGLGPGMSSGEFADLQVVEQATGKPVSGAEVQITNRRMHNLILPNRSLLTDADGKVRVPLGPAIPPAQRSLTVSVYKAGLYGPREFWREAQLPTEVTWRMKPATTIGGVVLKSDGTPMAGALVSVYVLPHFRDNEDAPPGTSPTPQFAEERVTDAQGRWRCGSVPANSTEITVRVSNREIWWRDFRTTAPGTAPRQGEQDSPVDRGEAVDREALLAQTAEFRVEPRVTMSVALQAEDGSPVPFGEVTMSAHPVVAPDPAANRGLIMPRDYYYGNRTVRSGRTGHVLFHWNEPMEVTVSAYPTKNSALIIRNVIVSKDMAPIELRASPKRRITGHIANLDGVPLDGVQVTYVGSPTDQVEQRITRTNQSGDFAWDAAPSTEVGLVFDKGGYLRSMEWVPVDKKEPLKIEMREP